MINLYWIKGVIQPKQGCTESNKIPRIKAFRPEFIGPSSVYWATEIYKGVFTLVVILIII